MTAHALKLPGDSVYVSNEGSCAAVFFGPDQWKMPVRAMVKQWPSALRAGFVGMRGLRLNAATQRAHPRAPHRYLELIGTLPDRQGKGAGSAMLRLLLELCDREGLPAYLESSNPDNDPFYARHGFKPTPPFALPRGCPPLTPMWREPSM